MSRFVTIPYREIVNNPFYTSLPLSVILRRCMEKQKVSYRRVISWEVLLDRLAIEVEYETTSKGCS